MLSNGQAITASVRDGVFSSDHREVVCDISAVRIPVPLVTRISALNYRRADWDGLRAALRLVPWSMLDNLPVDDATTLFYELLNSAITDHVPVVHLKRRQPPWFDLELRTALSEKEAAHRRMKRTRTPETEAAFTGKRRIFKPLASSNFYEYLKNLTDDLKANHKRFWSYVKTVKSRNS